jgi:hypothetical protein
MTMTADEYARWQVEQEIIDGLLDRVERVEHGILRSAGCDPHSPAVRDYMADFRKGKSGIPPPRTKRTAARDVKRIEHAIWTLALIEQARRYLGFEHDNARLAAHAALLAGLYAGDAFLATVDAQKNCKGGQARGRQKAEEATKHDKTMTKFYRRWLISDELQFQYRSPVAYIQHGMKWEEGVKLQPRTIQRFISRTRQ